MQAIILAGGLGTRLRPRVADMPKPMAPVGARPFLEYLLVRLSDAGFANVVLSVGYLHERIIEHFGQSFRKLEISYSIETTPLGTGGARRAAVLPEVPTIAEGGLPGYEASNWWGILAPAGTPALITRKLNTELNAIMKLPETQKRLISEGAEPVTGTPEDFSALIDAEMVKWAKVAKLANIQAE